ncbi:MAG: ATP-binding protein [Deltaproteobacteria bacterium]|nr:ATP-binding protein [Deltaproteobacteria bacterium]
MTWGFYGRSEEQGHLDAILRRGRFAFVEVTGRRRIGKTSLVQRVLPASRPRFYVQLPDSAPAGILSAFHDAMEVLAIDVERFPRPRSLADAARFLAQLLRAGYVVAVDEFQYLARTQLAELPSALQREVDGLQSEADRVPGVLLVLGSVHTEMAALLEERTAPLFNRTTDRVFVSHLDAGSLKELLSAHGGVEPERFLFLWSLFEGVPKFYRDAYEQGVLEVTTRRRVLERLFFQSSSPLRHEADNWFLKELRGRYDVALKYIARHPGCTHANLVAHVRATSPDTDEQVGGYLKVLTERFGMVERRLPMFARREQKQGRYYITDNFLRSWLAALKQTTDALAFLPVPQLVAQADERLQEVEGHSLEKLAGALLQERSRKGVGAISITEHIRGYWDRAGTEIDLVAKNDSAEKLWLGQCRRDATRLVAGAHALDGHAARFVGARQELRPFSVEKLAVAPRIDPDTRAELRSLGHIPLDLTDLLEGL